MRRRPRELPGHEPGLSCRRKIKRKIKLALGPGGAERRIVKSVHQILDDTKGKQAEKRALTAGGPAEVEKPEAVWEKLQEQATSLGPVLEAILRESRGQGQSHWGLNE